MCFDCNGCECDFAVLCVNVRKHKGKSHRLHILILYLLSFSISFTFSSLLFLFSMPFNCRDSNPVLILKPAELAGMSLENRLTSYDWQSQFDVFQRVTRNGSFRPICLDAKNNMLAVSTCKIYKTFCH